MLAISSVAFNATLVYDACTFRRLLLPFAEKLVYKRAAAPFWAEALIVGETDQSERTWGPWRAKWKREREGGGRGVGDGLSGCLEQKLKASLVAGQYYTRDGRG